MTSDRSADTTWRLDVRNVQTGSIGCAFGVAPGWALTCAHVIASAERCAVTASATGLSAEDCQFEVAAAYLCDPRMDVAAIRVPGLTAVAPLGSIERPARGTVVEIFGPYSSRDQRGRHVRGRIAGPDASGRWIQVDALDAHTSWVLPGFSGSAVVSSVSGLVVGMVVWTARSDSRPDRAAWLIPLDTLVEGLVEDLAWLAKVLARPLQADETFRAFQQALSLRRYGEALYLLAEVQQRRPTESDIYYYWALALLQGVRPGNHSGETIEDIERLLLEAIRLDKQSAHSRTLLVLVREDYFHLRGLIAPALPIDGDVPATLTTGHAQEIIAHVPAVECASWRRIKQRSRA